MSEELQSRRSGASQRSRWSIGDDIVTAPMGRMAQHRPKPIVTIKPDAARIQKLFDELECLIAASCDPAKQQRQLRVNYTLNNVVVSVVDEDSANPIKARITSKTWLRRSISAPLAAEVRWRSLIWWFLLSRMARHGSWNPYRRKDGATSEDDEL